MKLLQIQDNGSGIRVRATFLGGVAASCKLQLYRKQIYPSWLNVSRRLSCLRSRTYHVSRPMDFGVKHLRLSPMLPNFLLLLKRRTILAHGSTFETYSSTFFQSESVSGHFIQTVPLWIPRGRKSLNQGLVPGTMAQQSLLASALTAGNDRK